MTIKDDEKDQSRSDHPSVLSVVTNAATTDAEPPKCQKCGTVAPLYNWSGEHDATSIARNWSLVQLWCHHCVLTAQVAYARKVKPHLEEAERELAALERSVIELTADELARIFDDMKVEGARQEQWDSLSEADRFTVFSMLMDIVRDNKQQTQEP